MYRKEVNIIISEKIKVRDNIIKRLFCRRILSSDTDEKRESGVKDMRDGKAQKRRATAGGNVHGRVFW
jgi:hypothetical protein